MLCWRADFDPRRVAYVPKSIDVVTNQAIEPASIVTSQPDVGDYMQTHDDGLSD
jgi:hypothetical protein